MALAAQPPLPLPMGEVAERSEDGEGAGSCKYEKIRRLHLGTLSVTAAPCQLSHRESQGAGFARPVQRVRQCDPGGAAALFLSDLSIIPQYPLDKMI